MPLKWNVLGKLSAWANKYTNCYIFKNWGTGGVFGQNGIERAWNNDQKVKLVKWLMAGIKQFIGI